MTEMQHLESQVKEVDKKVTSILGLLKGNELDKEDKGMIGVQNNHEERLSSLEKIKDRGMYFLIGLSIPAGWGVIDILQKILIK